MKLWHNWRDEVIAVLKGQISWLQERHDQDRERIDRLTEALAQKAGVNLIMPAPPLPPVEHTKIPNPYKDWQIATPVKETQ